jgi:hypothetical protein
MSRPLPSASPAPVGPTVTAGSGDDAVFTLHRGTRPLLVSVPHVGTEIPAELKDRFVARALHVGTPTGTSRRCTTSRASWARACWCLGTAAMSST